MSLSYFMDNAPVSVKNSFIHRKHTKGSYILYPGEENNYLYIVIKGSANVVIQNISGAGFVLYTYAAYSCFGEMELFNKDIKTFDVIAQSNCETIIVQKERVFEWMKADFEFTKFLIEQLTEKLLKSSQKLTTISLLSVNDRLLYCIYTHYKLGDLAKLTKQMVCSETFIPLRSLNRGIADCKENNYFEFRRKQFYVLSEERLEVYCSSLV
ncbi:Crp/Fnr family transcriptional regulator [Lacrimispora sp.]|uniref:Crp/Fnr family transcriptional regulator n=1 Tax=Lacrimispora sp. TaxID=2719234 RepID=UPI0028B1663E|nr:Crp/Fnr family transcriptional regulator [Lacrimispora sp.]